MIKIFYNDEEGNIKVEVLLENENVQLKKEVIEILFNVDRSGIVSHIKNIYADAQLEKIAHVQKLHIWVMMANKLTLQNIIISI